MDRTTETLQSVLEEQYQTYTGRLAVLTAYHGRPDHGGYDADALTALIAWARKGIAEAAGALRRMSDGTYGVCERCGEQIAVDLLRAQPQTGTCGSCR